MRKRQGVSGDSSAEEAFLPVDMGVQILKDMIEK